MNKTLIPKWLSIPNFPGYEVSNYGEVRSFWRRSSNGYGKGGKRILAEKPQIILRPRLVRGYSTVGLRQNGKIHTFKIHSLVLHSFIGPRPINMECCHNDGRKTNNFLENLRWDTRRGNCADTRRHGSQKGIKNGRTKLTETQVIQIRDLAPQGHSRSKIGKMFNVSKSNINSIIWRKTWTHI